MASYVTLTQNITCKHNNKIKLFCRDLFLFFNFNNFYYYKLTNSGHFTYLCSHAAWCEYFGEEKFYLNYPYIHHPKYFQNSVLLINNDSQDKSLREIYNSDKEKFHFSLMFKMINKLADGFEVFGYSSNQSNERQVVTLLNELPLLHLFNKKSKKDNRFLFSKLEDNQISLIELIGPTFYENTIPTPPQDNAKRAFLKKLGIEIEHPLTPREVQVIKLLLDGYSATKIALQIHPFKTNRRTLYRANKRRTGMLFKS